MTGTQTTPPKRVLGEPVLSGRRSRWETLLRDLASPSMERLWLEVHGQYPNTSTENRCPQEIRVPLEALLRQAFLRGVRRAPLVALALDLEIGEHRTPKFLSTGWTRGADVVIPVRGAHEQLKLCLAALEAHTRRDVRVFLVCAPAERDAVVRIAMGAFPGDITNRRKWEVVNPGAPVGFAAACNRGFDETKTEVVVFLNSDAYVTPGWLEPLERELHSDAGHVAAGPLGTNVSGHQGVANGPLWTSERVRGLEPIRGMGERFSPRASYSARRLVGFCLAVARGPFQMVGKWWTDWPDPAGNWDDDMLSFMLTCGFGAQALRVAGDSFVVHEGSASFLELDPTGAALNTALETNGARFQELLSWILPDWHRWLNRAEVV